MQRAVYSLLSQTSFKDFWDILFTAHQKLFHAHLQQHRVGVWLHPTDRWRTLSSEAPTKKSKNKLRWGNKSERRHLKRGGRKMGAKSGQHWILCVSHVGLIFREEEQRGELPTLAVQHSRETSVQEPKTEPRCSGGELQEGKLQAASCKDGHLKKGCVCSGTAPLRFAHRVLCFLCFISGETLTTLPWWFARLPTAFSFLEVQENGG